jgi:hypothetical protein
MQAATASELQQQQLLLDVVMMLAVAIRALSLVLCAHNQRLLHLYAALSAAQSKDGGKVL